MTKTRRSRTSGTSKARTRTSNGVTGYEFLDNPALLGVVSNPPRRRVRDDYDEEPEGMQQPWSRRALEAHTEETLAFQRRINENPEPIELGRVVEIKYKHAQNGKYYRHTFDKKPSILLLPDGRVEIFHPTLRLWDEFPD